MGLRVRTQTVQDGATGKRDVKWGLDAIGSLIAILLFLGAIAKGVWRVAEVVTTWDGRLDRVEATTTEGKAERTKLRDEFDAHVAKSEEEHKHFLSKDEFYSYMAPEIRRHKGDQK